MDPALHLWFLPSNLVHGCVYVWRICMSLCEAFSLAVRLWAQRVGLGLKLVKKWRKKATSAVISSVTFLSSVSFLVVFLTNCISLVLTHWIR